MTLQSLNFENIEFTPSDLKNSSTIESSLSSLLESGLTRLEEDSRFEKIELTEIEKEEVEGWRNSAIEVLKDLGCEDLISRVPKVTEVRIYRVLSAEMADNIEIEGGVDEFGQKILFFVNKNVNITDHKFRKIFTHEIAHIVATRVVGLNEEDIAQTNFIGYEKNTGFTKEKLLSGDYKVSKRNKVAFTEPIADIFSYLCSEKEGRPNHFVLDEYIRETSFLFGLLDRMSSANDSGFIEEYGVLFQSFNHRDYSWYTRLLSTFEKIYQSDNSTNETTAHVRAVSFARDMNNIVFENGKDVVHLNDRDRFGSQLSEIAKKGGFFDNYDNFCNHLVGHRSGIRFDGTSCWIK